MELIFIFVFGGLSYGVLEIMWRGYTHWTMLVTGGICLILIYLISTRISFLPAFMRAVLCSLAVTAVEYAVGCIVNLKLGWNVWDYSSNTMNLHGQVCALYTVLWFFLSLVLVPLCERAQGSIF